MCPIGTHKNRKAGPHRDPAGIRELRKQLEDSVDLRGRGLDDHAAIETAPPFDVHRLGFGASFRAPPAIRNGHVTSQVRSLFSSASSSPFPVALPDCA